MCMRLHELIEELTQSKLQRVLRFMFLETHHPLSNFTQYGKVMESWKRRGGLDSKLGARDYWLNIYSSGSNPSVIFTFGLELFAGRNLKCKYFKSRECRESNRVWVLLFSLTRNKVSSFLDFLYWHLNETIITTEKNEKVPLSSLIVTNQKGLYISFS